MNTIPDLEYTPPPFDSEILERLLDHLYHIVPMTKSLANPDTPEETKEACVSKIYEVTIALGHTLTLIKQGVDQMDEQIKGLIAHSKQRTESSLN